MLKTCGYICTMTTSIPINYKTAWTNTYILIGIVCIFIFLLGFLVVGDFMNLVYSLASVVPIYLGIKMKKSPYAIVSKSKIEVFGLFGELKHEYVCDSESKFLRVGNRIIIKNNKVSKKVKMNKWFVNDEDWKAVLELFK